MNIVRFLILIFVLPGILSCNRKTEKSKERPAPIVDVIVAEKSSFPSSVEVNGLALSEEMIELYPEISGRITYLNLPDGAFVKSGTVLVKINDADLQAQLEEQKVQLDLAVKTEKRLKALLEVNGVNQSDYDAALSQVNLITANINVLNAQIDKTVVRAPFSGNLGIREVSPGAYVTPQTQLGTLQQTDKMKIDFTLPEIYLNLVAAGKTVYIQTTGMKERQPAVISAIEPQINVDTRNIKIRARLQNNNIRPGEFVKVFLLRTEEGIAVPSNALIPDASSNLVVLIKNNKAVFANVETGIRNADMVNLLKGVNPGDTIVVSGVLFVRPNAIVRIRKVINQTPVKNSDPNPLMK